VSRRRSVRPVIRRIVVTSASGALSYPLTNLLFDAQSQQIAMSAAVGAFALVVQLLAEIDQRLAVVETGQVETTDEVNRVVDRGFQKVSEATEAFSRIEASGLSTARLAELAGKAGEIGPDAPPLIKAFAQSEIDRVTELCAALADSGLSRDGEDHDYLLTLTGFAQHSIDATSLFAVDAAGMSGESGFWNSDLGQCYLELQRLAVDRGVRVRRIFVVESEELISREQFDTLCQTQKECGIDVRVLVPSGVSMRQVFRDYVLFDDTISYETTPCIRMPQNNGEPRIQSTSVTSRGQQVSSFIEDYARLWEASAPLWAPRLAQQAPSAAGARLDRGSSPVASSP
jgi:hypothetical protein